MTVAVESNFTNSHAFIDVPSRPMLEAPPWVEVQPTVEEPPATRRRHRPSLAWRILCSRTLWFLAVGAVALLARITALPTAYDIFIDEISYTSISMNLARGRGVELYGLPFALHPPAAFGLYAAVILAFGLHGSTESTLFSLRYVDVIVGTLTCLVTFLLVERVATRWVAVIVALLLAVDPLAISFDSRVMLEAPAQLAMVSLFLCLAMADMTRSGSLGHWAWVIGAGLAAGTVVTTKETFGLVVVFALFLLWATGWVIARREAFVVAIMAAVAYVGMVIALSWSFGFAAWWHAKEDGILRLVGTKQISGFNSASTHVSIQSRILADLGTFAVTYVVLVVGVAAAAGLLWRMEPWSSRQYPRDVRDRLTVLMAVWTVAAAAYLVYATLFGTIEEQMYYILLLPSLISLCLWVAGVESWRRGKWLVTGAVLLLVAMGFNLFVWTSVHAGRDDEYRQLLRWEGNKVPPSAVVSSTDGASQFLMHRGVIGQWGTLAQMRAHHVDYVVIATTLVDQGYGIASKSFLTTVERGGHLVFEANGISDGSLRVYKVQGITGAAR
jgi:4-amino-4-deoxy-L-arabinose transferase-like glycosyltransferase